MKKIKKAASWLVNNPDLFFKHFAVRIRKLIPLPESPARKATNGVIFEYDFAFDPVIKSMYYGGFELDVLEAMKKILKKGDTFIDVGASIGYLSAMAAGLIGVAGQVHSFEPVPQYFLKLKSMSQLNPAHKIVVNPCAIGDKNGESEIGVNNVSYMSWNTMVPSFMKSSKIKKVVRVPVKRLDDYIKDNALDRISLIKIDVEGFEFPALRGLSSYFENTSHRPVIICEIFAHAYPLMGRTLDELSGYMKGYGYDAYSLFNLRRRIDILKLKEISDVVFRAPDKR